MKIRKIHVATLLFSTLLLFACKKDDTPAVSPDIHFSKLTVTGSQFAPLFEHQAVVFNGKLF